MSFGLPYTTVNVQRAQLRCDLHNDASGMSCMSVFPEHLIDKAQAMVIEPSDGALCYRAAGEPITDQELRKRARAIGWRQVRVADCWLDVCPKHRVGLAGDPQ